MIIWTVPGSAIGVVLRKSSTSTVKEISIVV